MKNIKYRNGEKVLPTDKSELTSYEEMIEKISKKLGKRPKLSGKLPKGNWTKQARKVLEERYLRKDENGKIIENPDEMCWRVSWDIASSEVLWGKNKKDITNIASRYYKLLVSHSFLPNSPTIMNAGTGNGLQYSACFVLPIEDSLIGIFDAIKYQALIHQTGGGTGFSFSRLRSRGSMVKSSRGTASGPVSFMRIFDAATNEIKQGGKRRGANMGILRIDHPDILEFIHCKEEGGITNFNISVAVTDKFMQALEKDSDYELISPKKGTNGMSHEIVGKLSARKVWDEIAEAAWRTGDPGLIFIDKINRSSANPVPELGPIESTNPCGEQPLYPYDSCNLGSIFLNNFIEDNESLSKVKRVDWEKLKNAVHLSVRFLDDVIQMNPYPLKEIRQVSLAIRRIGLGVGGWADMLVKLGIKYDSEEALRLGEKIMRFIHKEAIYQSEKLAEERGSFPMFSASIYKNKTPRRNSTVTTIAPTGSISIIAGTSSGIEPLFAVAYQHIVKDKHLDRTLTFFNPAFENIAKKRGFWTDEVKEKVSKKGVVSEIEEIPEDIREIFTTAHEIHHDWHIKHQATFQKYTENAVSKTINMANSVTSDDIKKAYLLAWKTDCKGITVFRDGCKNSQVLNVGVNNQKEKDNLNQIKEDSVEERPFMVMGSTYKLNTPVGTAFVTINQDKNGEPLELFVNVGKAGSDVTAMAEALGRTISTSLRFRGNLKRVERAKEIALQLAGIGGRRSVGFGPNKILSLPDAIAMAISTHFGFKVNGFLTASNLGNLSSSSATTIKIENGETVNSYIKSKRVENIKALAEAKLDLAGTVMPARYPARQDLAFAGDDHTTVSAESQLTSAVSGQKYNLNSSEVNNFQNTKSDPSPAGDGDISINQLTLDAVDDGSLKKGNDLCPSCGAGSYIYEEGCAKCFSCGYSEC